jgi:hypothetical protein
MFSGENERDMCERALHRQSYHNWEQIWFEGLPNVEAHSRLYKTIDEQRENYGLFVKLDADMVLRSPWSLEAVVSLFAADPNLDHAVFSVQDYLSRMRIMGLHVFSSRVRWPRSSEGLFVDPTPTYSGRLDVRWDPPAPVALHSPNPSPKQAFFFGVHRGFKAFQPGRAELKLGQAHYQWKLLRNVWRHCVVRDERRAALAVAGADLVWQGELAPSQDYKSAEAERHFQDLECLDLPALRSRLNRRWGSEDRQWASWLRSHGWRAGRAIGERLKR